MEELIETIKNEVCKGCRFSKFGNEICAGEILPIEAAIIKNLEGRGLCKNVKEYAEKYEESENEKN